MFGLEKLRDIYRRMAMVPGFDLSGKDLDFVLDLHGRRVASERIKGMTAKAIIIDENTKICDAAGHVISENPSVRYKDGREFLVWDPK